MWFQSGYFTHGRVQGRTVRLLRLRRWLPLPPRAPSLRELCAEIESILARLRLIDPEELPEAAFEAYMNLIAQEQVFTRHAEALLHPFRPPNRRFRIYLADCLQRMSAEISKFEEQFGPPPGEGFGGYVIRKVDAQRDHGAS